MIPPQQLQALLDLGEIRVRQRNRANVGIVAVPCAVEVVGHDIEPVHRRIDRDDIEMLHVPVRRGLGGINDGLLRFSLPDARRLTIVIERPKRLPVPSSALRKFRRKAG